MNLPAERFPQDYKGIMIPETYPSLLKEVGRALEEQRNRLKTDPTDTLMTVFPSDQAIQDLTAATSGLPAYNPAYPASLARRAVESSPQADVLDEKLTVTGGDVYQLLERTQLEQSTARATNNGGRVQLSALDAVHAAEGLVRQAKRLEASAVPSQTLQYVALKSQISAKRTLADALITCTLLSLDQQVTFTPDMLSK